MSMNTISKPIPATISAPFLCLAMNSEVFLVSLAAFFAALAVVSDALMVLLVDLPAFAAMYSFLMARFCCHLE